MTNQTLLNNVMEENIEPVVENNLIITIVYPDKTIQKELTVSSDKKITIGSASTCDIVLCHNSIAPEHFSFYYNKEIERLEKIDDNTLLKKKKIYAGMLTISIEKQQSQTYISMDKKVFKAFTQGVSFFKLSFFFLLLAGFIIISQWNNLLFFLNNTEERDNNYYFFYWNFSSLFIANLYILFSSIIYYITPKVERTPFLILLQYFFKYSSIYLFFYIILDSFLYFLNGIISFPSLYPHILMAYLVISLFHIFKKIFALNNFSSSTKRDIKINHWIIFIFLGVFSQIPTFHTDYVTWLPKKSLSNIQKNQELEKKTQELIQNINKK